MKKFAKLFAVILAAVLVFPFHTGNRKKMSCIGRKGQNDITSEPEKA